MNSRSFLAALALCLLATLAIPFQTAWADEVVKKDGSSVKGFIVSQSSRIIRIMDARGRTQRISTKDVESVIEGPETGDETVDAKLDEIDSTDADELTEVAKWAKGKKIKAWRLVAMQALRADESHDEAHTLLGHIKVEDTWFTKKKDADKARKKLVAKRMKEEGYKKWRGGWISADDYRLAVKDSSAFVKDDDGVWRDKATIMREKGFVLMKGKWVRAGTKEDKADISKFKDIMGEDIWVVTTEHFRLFVQKFSPDKVDEYGKLVEKTYDWCLTQFGLPEGTDLWNGNKANMWAFDSKNTAQKWFTNYRVKYGLSDRFGKLLESGGGNILSDGNLLAIHVPDDDGTRLPNQLSNHAAHMCLRFFSRGLNEPSPWLFEGFGVTAEDAMLGNGVVVHSTLAKYGGSGGRADKGFATKDAEDRAKGTVRAGEDESLEILNKLELNALSGDHIAKAYTFCRWLLKEQPDKFREFLKARNTNSTMDAIRKAFGESDGALDKRWRDMVKKNF